MSDVKKPEDTAGENTAGAAKTEGAKAPAKSGKNQPSPEALAASAGKTKEYFDEQGAKSATNRAAGGDDVKISLTNKTMVKFTKDHGFFKKGHVQEVSDAALAIYEKAKAIEKV